MEKMEFDQEDDISNLSKEINDNLDEIKIILTFTERVDGYYQTENNNCSEFSNESDEYDMESDSFSLEDFYDYDENKNIFFGEVLIIDKCEINPKSFIKSLENFYKDDDYEDKDWYSFTQEYLMNLGAGVREIFGVQGYDGSDENIFKIDKQIESELQLDSDSNLVTTLCIKESNEEEWEFEIMKINDQ